MHIKYVYFKATAGMRHGHHCKQAITMHKFDSHAIKHHFSNWVGNQGAIQLLFFSIEWFTLSHTLVLDEDEEADVVVVVSV